MLSCFGTLSPYNLIIGRFGGGNRVSPFFSRNYEPIEHRIPLAADLEHDGQGVSDGANSACGRGSDHEMQNRNLQFRPSSLAAGVRGLFDS